MRLGQHCLKVKENTVSQTALIIEDEYAIRVVYETVLRRLGFEAIHAADGEAALSVLDYCTPALILLDVLLPKLDGLEVFKQIQAMPHLQHVPVVVITAHHEYQRDLALMPKDVFLVKPVRPRDLAQAAAGLVTVP